jgi:hypothetical protein
MPDLCPRPLRNRIPAKGLWWQERKYVEEGGVGMRMFRRFIQRENFCTIRPAVAAAIFSAATSLPAIAEEIIAPRIDREQIATSAIYELALECMNGELPDKSAVDFSRSLIAIENANSLSIDPSLFDKKCVDKISTVIGNDLNDAESLQLANTLQLESITEAFLKKSVASRNNAIIAAWIDGGDDNSFSLSIVPFLMEYQDQFDPILLSQMIGRVVSRLDTASALPLLMSLSSKPSSIAKNAQLFAFLSARQDSDLLAKVRSGEGNRSFCLQQQCLILPPDLICKSGAELSIEHSASLKHEWIFGDRRRAAACLAELFSLTLIDEHHRERTSAFFYAAGKIGLISGSCPWQVVAKAFFDRVISTEPTEFISEPHLCSCELVQTSGIRSSEIFSYSLAKGCSAASFEDSGAGFYTNKYLSRYCEKNPEGLKNAELCSADKKTQIANFWKLHKLTP